MWAEESQRGPGDSGSVAGKLRKGGLSNGSAFRRSEKMRPGNAFLKSIVSVGLWKIK